MAGGFMTLKRLDRDDAPVLAYPIENTPAVTGIPRTKIFEAVREKQLTARKAGRSTIIEHPELLRFIRSLPFKGREPDAVSDSIGR
jgi:hypothetical protein